MQRPLSFAALLRSLALSISVCGLLCSQVLANEPADPNAAQSLLEDIAGDMVSSLQDPGVRQDVGQLQDLVVRVLVPHIDFRVSSNLVLGPHWKDATETQQEAFIDEFKVFLVRFYAGALSSYVDSGEVPRDIMDFRDKPQMKDERQAIVRSHVGQATEDEVVEVNYRMFWRDGWKVIDVSVAGISMVQNYRSNFSSTVKNQGIDVLIAQLQERNQSLATN